MKLPKWLYQRRVSFNQVCMSRKSGGHQSHCECSGVTHMIRYDSELITGGFGVTWEHSSMKSLRNGVLKEVSRRSIFARFFWYIFWKWIVVRSICRQYTPCILLNFMKIDGAVSIVMCTIIARLEVLDKLDMEGSVTITHTYIKLYSHSSICADVK